MNVVAFKKTDALQPGLYSGQFCSRANSIHRQQ